MSLDLLSPDGDRAEASKPLYAPAAPDDRQVDRFVPSAAVACRNSHDARNGSGAGRHEAGRLRSRRRPARSAGGGHNGADEAFRLAGASNLRTSVRGGMAALGLPP